MDSSSLVLAAAAAMPVLAVLAKGRNDIKLPKNQFPCEQGKQEKKKKKRKILGGKKRQTNNDNIKIKDIFWRCATPFTSVCV